MHKLAMPLLWVAMSVALVSYGPVLAQNSAPSTPGKVSAPTLPDPVDRSAVESDPEKAAAARKQRCRLHPGTCTRGETPNKPPPRSGLPQ
jgi:hypothetical protein